MEVLEDLLAILVWYGVRTFILPVYSTGKVVVSYPGHETSKMGTHLWNCPLVSCLVWAFRDIANPRAPPGTQKW